MPILPKIQIPVANQKLAFYSNTVGGTAGSLKTIMGLLGIAKPSGLWLANDSASADPIAIGDATSQLIMLGAGGDIWIPCGNFDQVYIKSGGGGTPTFYAIAVGT